MINIVLAFVLVGRYGVLGLGAVLRASPTLSARCGRCRCCRTRCPGSRCAAMFASLWRMLLAGVVMAEVDVVRRPTRRRQRRHWTRSCARGGRHDRRASACTSASSPLLGAPELELLSCRLEPRRGSTRPLGSRACSKLFRKWWKYLGAKFNRNFDDEGRSGGPARAGAHRGAGSAPPAEGAGGQRHRQPEAEPRSASTRKMAELEKLNGNARQALIMAADAAEGRRHRQGHAVQRRGRDHRQPADPGREGRRGPQGDGDRVPPRPPIRPRPPSPRTAACCSRSWPRRTSCSRQLEQAKMQEEMNTAMTQLSETVGDDVPTLKEVQREDRGPLREGQGHRRAQRDLGRQPHPRDRAGHRERRGPEPPEPAARRARTRAAAPGRRRDRPAGRRDDAPTSPPGRRRVAPRAEVLPRPG